MPPKTRKSHKEGARVPVQPPKNPNGIYDSAELEAMTEDQRESIMAANRFAGVVPGPGVGEDTTMANPPPEDDKHEVVSGGPVVNERDGTVTLLGESYRSWVLSVARENVKRSVVENKLAGISLKDAGERLETDVVKACKLMANSDIKPFDGLATVDVMVWLMKFKTALLLRWIHPVIFHWLAFQYVAGVALSAVEKVLATDDCPANFEAFSALLIHCFPPTITKSSIKEEYSTFKMISGESVTDYYDRFLLLEDRALSIGFAHEPVSEFVEGLIPSLRTAVDEEIDRRVGASEPVDLAHVALWAITRDNRYRARKTREKVSQVGESSSGNKKRKANSKPEGNERTCDNCEKPGHIAADCPEPKTEKSKAYMAAKGKGKEKA